jgi:hypothetical protein
MTRAGREKLELRDGTLSFDSLIDRCHSFLDFAGLFAHTASMA